MADVFRHAVIQNLTDSIGNPGFQASCLQKLQALPFSDWLNIEFRDQYGNPMSNFTSDTWGISTHTCQQYCSMGQVPYPFNYATFANAMTNFLLPWLALTAQLPYETGDPWANVMAFCMAVGSPALITYSLTLTILNRSWARNYFADLKVKAMVDVVRRRAPDFDRKITAMQFLVQESQQSPLRTSQEKGWLASLIVLPRNVKWWERLEVRLRSTRRGFSPSLVAQMSLAVTAWLLTVIAAFVASLGDPDTALQIASGSLWIWLVPVVLGWVTVGTQVTDHSIEDALRADTAWRAREPPLNDTTDPNHHRNSLREDGDDFAEKAHQKGIERRGGLSPQPQNSLAAATAAGAQQWSSIANLEVAGWLGFRVGGDEEIKGPTYNYARLFTWWQVVNTLGKSTYATLDKIDNGRVCQLSHLTSPTPPEWIEHHKLFNADSNAISAYANLNNAQDCKQYPSWSELPAQVYRRMLAAAFAAVFVQWGTAGDSILTAYLTPTVGLGCRSGSYLLYAGTSTLAWILLVLGMLCSHQAMLYYQKAVLELSTRRLSTSGNPNDPKDFKRSRMHGVACAAAVMFRIAGKTLCIVNTIWLLLTSVMEFVGGFDNCWCEGNSPSMGDRGSFVVFKTSKDLAQAAGLFWGGGLAMTVLTICVAVGFFAMGTWKPDKD